MANDVDVEALKPFNRTAQGDIVHPGDPPFAVSPTRARELETLGLAKRIGDTKAAPEPGNKMAGEPENKAEKTVAVRKSPAKLSGRD